MRQQRRNRRQSRPVSDHAMLALHKYYLRASYLYEAYHAIQQTFIAKHGAAAWAITGMSEEVVRARMYLDLWWSTLYVVVEGYEKLGLHYPQTEAVLDQKMLKKLAAYRHGTYHFTERYFDPDKFGLHTQEGMNWVSELYTAIGVPLLEDMKARRAARTRPLNIVERPQSETANHRFIPHPSGGQVAFEVDGTGPVVLMIPSLGRPASDFDELARRLVAAGFTAVRPDPRGIGKSTGPMDGLTLHDLAADAAAVIEALGAKPVIVVGHAFGQRVGRTLAADRPELVRAMAMVAAGGRAPMKPGAQEALMGCFRLDRPDAERLADVRFAFFAPGNDPNIWRGGWYPDAAKAQIAATRATPIEGWWNAGSTTPLLVIQGLQDTVAPPENGRMMKAELGDRVELLEIDGAGHALLPEQPEKIAAAIVAFARKHQGER